MSGPAHPAQDDGTAGSAPAGSSAYPGGAVSGQPTGYDATPGHGQDATPGHGAAPAAAGTSDGVTAPAYSTKPVAFRRPDPLAALLWLLAGIAAAVSLLPTWLPGRDTGLELVRTGLSDLGDSFDRVRDSGSWQPVVIVLGGAVLFVLGVLALLPAKKRRFLGLVGLLVSLAVTAGVLVPLAAEDWDLGAFDVGFYFGVAVAVLGLLGSLKALLTGARHGTAGPRG